MGLREDQRIEVAALFLEQNQSLSKLRQQIIFSYFGSVFVVVAVVCVLVVVVVGSFACSKPFLATDFTLDHRRIFQKRAK